MADVKDLSAYKGVWVFAEQREGKIMPVVIELLGEGRKLADAVGCELCAVLLGDKVEGLTDELFAYGADKVYLADDPELKDYRTDAYSITIGKAIEEYKPEIVLLGATHIGRDLGPCLAVNCNRYHRKTEGILRMRYFRRYPACSRYAGFRADRCHQHQRVRTDL